MSPVNSIDKNKKKSKIHCMNTTNAKLTPPNNNMTIQRTYAEYLVEFNDKHTDFKHTSMGPVAKFNDIWYSVNGVAGNIVDVRYPLNVKELHELYKEIE